MCGVDSLFLTAEMCRPEMVTLVLEGNGVEVRQAPVLGFVTLFFLKQENLVGKHYRPPNILSIGVDSILLLLI